MAPHLRIARPVSNLERSVEIYCRGLGCPVLASFEDHDGFDGAMVGDPGGGYHFEFTKCRADPVRPTPTCEDLAVLYIVDPTEWSAACTRMIEAGFAEVEPHNPYWKARGRTFEDPDGYRVVLQNDAWGGGASPSPVSPQTPPRRR